MREKIVAGNWKMNTTIQEGVDLTISILEKYDEIPSGVKLIVIPPFTHIDAVGSILGESEVALGAQNCSEFEKGAYTGEVSCEMLDSLFCDYVILGHSERRQYFGETSEKIVRKIHLALSHQIEPIVCIGENLEDRNSGRHFEVVGRQLKEIMDGLSAEEMDDIIIAYEPVWAIGTGVTATTEQAQEMHAFIRKTISEAFGNETAQDIPLLYGGSCKPSNAAGLFACEDIDGGLIGGASLSAEDFIAIAKCHK